MLRHAAEGDGAGRQPDLSQNNEKRLRKVPPRSGGNNCPMGCQQGTTCEGRVGCC